MWHFSGSFKRNLTLVVQQGMTSKPAHLYPVVPAKLGTAQWRSASEDLRAVCLLTHHGSEDFTHPSSELPAVGWNQEPTMSPPSPPEAPVVHSHQLHAAMLYQPSALPFITVADGRLRAPQAARTGLVQNQVTCTDIRQKSGTTHSFVTEPEADHGSPTPWFSTLLI